VANEAFFDTNVLIYLLAAEPAKASRSREILAPGGVISVQVLNEFVTVARRKHALEWNEIEEWLAGFHRQFQVEPLTVATQSRAVEIARRHRMNVYDASILAAAQTAGCLTVYSEDMQDGQVIGGVTLRNPFAELG
jgi:predicted nucleic acid-binding protein